jgi:hypothetical protein
MENSKGLPSVTTFEYELTPGFGFRNFERQLEKSTTKRLKCSDPHGIICGDPERPAEAIFLISENHVYLEHAKNIVPGEIVKINYTPNAFWETFLGRPTLSFWRVSLFSTDPSLVDEGGIFLTGQRSRIDPSAIIDTLLLRGVVEVRLTKSVMCVDDRQFRFLDEDEFHDVDCIGSNACPEILEKIEEIWFENEGL